MRLDTETKAWEMHMHGAGALVGAAQDQLLAPGEQQLAGHRVDAVVSGADAHRLAGVKAVQVLKRLVRQRCRCSVARNLKAWSAVIWLGVPWPNPSTRPSHAHTAG